MSKHSPVRECFPSMSFPSFLDLVVEKEQIGLTNYIEVSREEYLNISEPNQSQVEPIRSLRFIDKIEPGRMPGRAEGVYFETFPCARLSFPYRRGEDLAEHLTNRFFRAHSFSVLNLKDPTIGSFENSEGAVWTLGIGYDGYLRPFYNAISFEVTTKMHPMRSVRNLGGPSCLFIYKPFLDMTFTECALTLKFNKSMGFRSNISNWVWPSHFDYTKTLLKEMPHFSFSVDPPDELTSQGGHWKGQIEADSSKTFEVTMLDSENRIVLRDCELYLEETGGYLPHRRVAIRQGRGQFRFVALSLLSGEKVRIKAGFRCLTGLTDLELTVR